MIAELLICGAALGAVPSVSGYMDPVPADPRWTESDTRKMMACSAKPDDVPICYGMIMSEVRKRPMPPPMRRVNQDPPPCSTLCDPGWGECGRASAGRTEYEQCRLLAGCPQKHSATQYGCTKDYHPIWIEGRRCTERAWPVGVVKQEPCPSRRGYHIWQPWSKKDGDGGWCFGCGVDRTGSRIELACPAGHLTYCKVKGEDKP